MSRSISRRALLVRACQMPLVGSALFALGCANDTPTPVCADPTQLSNSTNNLASSLQYTERSPDTSQTCSRCVYFRPAAELGECGRCEILHAPVNVQGHCTSWGPKA